LTGDYNNGYYPASCILYLVSLKNIFCTFWLFQEKCFKLVAVLAKSAPGRIVEVNHYLFHLLNFIPIVTTDISQLTAECANWRQQMRNNREEITQLKNQLRQIANKVTQKDLFQDVEHYENQFHIQLINIHDLKHSIKAHDLKASTEKNNDSGQVSDTTWAEHEQLFDDYQRLEHMLQELKSDFHQFVAKLN